MQVINYSRFFKIILSNYYSELIEVIPHTQSYVTSLNPSSYILFTSLGSDMLISVRK